MPAPLILAPVALRLLHIGAVAALVVIAARRRTNAPLDGKREAALDDAPDSGSLATRLGEGEARADAAGRWNRRIRLGRKGPGLEIDFAGIARARFRTI